MPPRPFPFAFRVGTDIVTQSRILRIITKEKPAAALRTQLETYLRRVFTPREVKSFRNRFPDFHVGDTSRLSTVTAYLAGRWAAKEAVVKAVKPRKLTMMDIEILQTPDIREPYALIRDKTFVRRPHADPGVWRPDLSREYTPEKAVTEVTFSKPSEPSLEAIEEEEDPAGQIAIISISHDAEYATAVCVAPLEAMTGDVGGEAAARMYFES